jgi:hypothetical protein
MPLAVSTVLATVCSVGAVQLCGGLQRVLGVQKCDTVIAQFLSLSGHVVRQMAEWVGCVSLSVEVTGSGKHHSHIMRSCLISNTNRRGLESALLFASCSTVGCLCYRMSVLQDVFVTGQQLCGGEGVDRYPDKDLSDECEQAETLPSVGVHQRALALVSTDGMPRARSSVVAAKNIFSVTSQKTLIFCSIAVRPSASSW